MAKGKTMSSKSMSMLKDGKGHMFGKQSAGPQKPGQSASMGKGGGKFMKGGSGSMFGKQSVKSSRKA